MKRVSCNWTKDAWVGRFDLRSFFMSIDKDLLWQMLRDFINGHYHGDDKDTLLWVSEVTVKHRPQDNCIRKGDLSLWDKLPRHKSLFYVNGMAIGNITSQILANFLLSVFDRWACNWCKEHGGCYVRFVDDMVAALPDKEDVLLFYQLAKEMLLRLTGLLFHADKVYVQHVSKGVKFIGSVIKPGRTYLSNRTVGRMWTMLEGMERHCKRLARRRRARREDVEVVEQDVCSCNSYMGFMVHHATYGLRRRMFGRMKWFWEVAYVSGSYTKVSLRRKYRMFNLNQ